MNGTIPLKLELKSNKDFQELKPVIKLTIDFKIRRVDV